jgi:hypothetical protein
MMMASCAVTLSDTLESEIRLIKHLIVLIERTGGGAGEDDLIRLFSVLFKIGDGVALYPCLPLHTTTRGAGEEDLSSVLSVPSVERTHVWGWTAGAYARHVRPALS